MSFTTNPEIQLCPLPLTWRVTSCSSTGNKWATFWEQLTSVTFILHKCNTTCIRNSLWISKMNNSSFFEHVLKAILPKENQEKDQKNAFKNLKKTQSWGIEPTLIFCSKWFRIFLKWSMYAERFLAVILAASPKPIIIGVFSVLKNDESIMIAQANNTKNTPVRRHKTGSLQTGFLQYAWKSFL